MVRQLARGTHMITLSSFCCHERLSVSAETGRMLRRSWLTVEELADWTVVAAASVFKQNLHSSRYLPSIYLKYDTVDTHYGHFFFLCYQHTSPSPHLRGMWRPGCERTLWRIVQSVAQPVWSDHSSQAGWCLARSVHSEELGGWVGGIFDGIWCLCNVGGHRVKWC